MYILDICIFKFIFTYLFLHNTASKLFFTKAKLFLNLINIVLSLNLNKTTCDTSIYAEL